MLAMQASRENRMAARLSRWLFVLELVVLALPAVAVLLPYALYLGGASLLMLLVGGFEAMRSGIGSLTLADLASALGLFAMFGGIAALAFAGIVALIRFGDIAHAFARRGRPGLRDVGSGFRRGLAWAAAPLALWVPFGLVGAGASHPADRIVGFYVSGLTLLVPVLHLWLEIRLAQAGGPRPETIDRAGTLPHIHGP
jgi:hypothetical protein